MVADFLNLWLRVSILPSHMSLCHSCLWRKSLSLASWWSGTQGSAMTEESESSSCSDLHFNEGSCLITPRNDPGKEKLHILVESGDGDWGEGDGGHLCKRVSPGHLKSCYTRIINEVELMSRHYFLPLNSPRHVSSLLHQHWIRQGS